MRVTFDRGVRFAWNNLIGSFITFRPIFFIDDKAFLLKTLISPLISHEDLNVL